MILFFSEQLQVWADLCVLKSPQYLRPISHQHMHTGMVDYLGHALLFWLVLFFWTAPRILVARCHTAGHNSTKWHWLWSRQEHVSSMSSVLSQFTLPPRQYLSGTVHPLFPERPTSEKDIAYSLLEN